MTPSAKPPQPASSVRTAQVRAAGTTAALLTVHPGTAAAWRELLLSLASDGILPPPDDVVPAHCTVLVDGVPAPAVRTALDGRSLPDQAATTRADHVVEIPTVYDGDDLAEVARLWGVDEAEVIKRHTTTDFEVDFCGFAPGFAYLTGLDADVPRRPSPRTRVPAGSVGLAGRYCGIYPSASPGGWQLIGRTATQLFDVTADPPALLPPGTRVRFMPVDEQPLPTPPPETAAPQQADGPHLTVVRPGALTTVQDAGRRGCAHLGVPRSGFLDHRAAQLANRLVGNEADAAMLETTLDGVSLRFAQPTNVAVTGAPAQLHVDGGAAEWGVAVPVPAGAVLDVGAAITGVRSYVAVGGGIDVTPVLGSRSTDLLSGLGPPPLAAGHVLPVGRAPDPPAPVSFTVPTRPGDVTLRLHVGPDDDWFSADGLRTLHGSAYTVMPASNRVGARLGGPAIAWARDREMDSVAMVLGAVQVPPDGEPIVFLADHPTTGGYPVIGVVDHDDLPALAQARPGTTVRFVVAGNTVRKD
jgi:biotin-dependent carboxylase-like uncharacterized protein